MRLRCGSIKTFTIGKQTIHRRAIIDDCLVAVDENLGLTPPGYQLPSLPGLVARPALPLRFGLATCKRVLAENKLCRS